MSGNGETSTVYNNSSVTVEKTGHWKYLVIVGFQVSGGL
jgi:hypothetical protein